MPDFLLSPKYRIIRHLLLQLMIILITMNVFWDVPDEMITTYDRFIAWFFYYLAICVILYLNIYVLAPRLLMKNRLLPYLMFVILSIIGVIVVIGILQMLVDGDSSTPPQEVHIGQVIFGIISSLLAIGLLVAGSSALLLFKSWIENNQRKNELESNTLQSELKHLKEQINPHFLFNMLNNANVLVKKRPEEASQVLFKLEDLLRYQINDSAKDKVQLSSEIHFLNDFLNLEKVRRDKFYYTISKEGDINHVELPPLLFIPFVENAVKHNPDSENESYVHLSFKVHNQKLIFTCVNSKPSILPDKKEVGGLGLKNIRRRLELLFADHYQLDINEDETTYNIMLELKV